MRPNPHRGRVYRRCACRGADGKQLGTRCPKLTNARHGTWAYAVDLPTLDRRKTTRRGGFATKAEASAALTNVLQCERAGVSIDDTETVADYLHRWFEAKAPTRKPNTVNRYRAYLDNDLIPAFGAIRLERLTTSTSPSSSAANWTPGGAWSPCAGVSPRCRPRSTTRGACTGSTTTPPATRRSPVGPARNSPAGAPPRPAPSCATATRPTNLWLTCTS